MPSQPLTSCLGVSQATHRHNDIACRSSCQQIILAAPLSPAGPYDEVVRDVEEHDDDAGEGPNSEHALAEDLGWGLGMVFRAYVKAAHAAVADVPGGPRGYQVLSAAAHGAVGSQLALAQHLGVDRTVMTYLLDDLEAAGLIERRPDPADRRARRVVATRRGAEVLVTLDHRLRAAEGRLLAPLDDGARKVFRSQLRLLATQVNLVDPPDSPCELADEVDAELPSRRVPTRSARRDRPRPPQ
jgi:DNA-binding MarR family transcriptional regulator